MPPDEETSRTPSEFDRLKAQKDAIVTRENEDWMRLGAERCIRIVEAYGHMTRHLYQEGPGQGDRRLLGMAAGADDIAQMLREMPPEPELEQLRDALEGIVNLGHNDDCLFCALKDTAIKAVATQLDKLRETPADTPQAIRFWCEERIRLGKNNHGDPQIVEALECALAMETERNAPCGEIIPLRL
jgi:hypothetical protein